MASSFRYDEKANRRGGAFSCLNFLILPYLPVCNIVAVGTIISAFWISSANSWVQTPQGFEVGEDGLLYPTSWLEIIFNPSFPVRFFHMVTVAYLTTAFVVAGIGAYYLWRNIHVKHAKVIFGMLNEHTETTDYSIGYCIDRDIN